jgi:hypothetical protein
LSGQIDALLAFAATNRLASNSADEYVAGIRRRSAKELRCGNR